MHPLPLKNSLRRDRGGRPARSSRRRTLRRGPNQGPAGDLPDDFDFDEAAAAHEEDSLDDGIGDDEDDQSQADAESEDAF